MVKKSEFENASLVSVSVMRVFDRVVVRVVRALVTFVFIISML